MFKVSIFHSLFLNDHPQEVVPYFCQTYPCGSHIINFEDCLHGFSSPKFSETFCFVFHDLFDIFHDIL